MEDGLAHYNYERYKEHSRGLNPCCSGRWSRTFVGITLTHARTRVLILIVVDNGLVHAAINVYPSKEKVLILIVVDNGLVRK